jgi:hypothetical protein
MAPNPEQIDSDGWLAPVANPENPGAKGTHSPEGQAFVVEMQAAWQDWVAIGSPGANTPRTMRATSGAVVAGVVLALALAV